MGRVRRISRPDGGSRGQAMVEMAMTFPIVFVIIVAVMELGFAFNAYTTVVAAARNGARAGVVYLYNENLSVGENHQNRESGIAANPADVYQDNVRATVANSLSSLRSGLTYDVNISYTQATPHLGSESGDMINVEVVYHYRPVTGVLGSWEIPIRAESSGRME